MDTKDLERSFMFTTNFQSSGAIAKGMMPVVATLTNNPDFLEKLREEVDGKVGCGLSARNQTRTKILIVTGLRCSVRRSVTSLKN